MDDSSTSVFVGSQGYEADLDAVLERLEAVKLPADILIPPSVGAPPLEFYHAYDRHEPVVIRVMSTDAGGDARTRLVFHKVRGDTIAFMNIYGRILRGLLAAKRITPDTEAEVLDIARDIEHQGLSQASAPLHLENTADFTKTFLPVRAMLRSEWTKSVIEGLQVVATLSDLPENARFLLREGTIFADLVAASEQSYFAPNRQAVRLMARIAANILSWGLPAAGEQLEHAKKIVARLSGIIPTTGEDRAWFHARIELERLMRLSLAHHL